MNTSKCLGAADSAKCFGRQGFWRSLENIKNPVTHQRFWGGEVFGGHLSAECRSVSMMSTGELYDYSPQAGSWCLGCRQRSKRAEG